MRQHNPSGESRKCWRTARERSRLQARYSIRERVATASSINKQPATVSITQQEQIVPILGNILEGNRSFFSLTYLEEHAQLLSTPVPTEYLWEDGDKKTQLLGIEKLTSWFGKEGVKDFERYIRNLQTCTLYEYAVWLERHFIVGSFLLGGISPCLRGSTFSTNNHNDKWDNELQEIGTAMLKRFLDSVPLTLSSYIVKRVVDLRRAAWEHYSIVDNVYSCANCDRKVPANFALYISSCQHVLCEPCLWRDLIDHMDQRHGDDVVLCPVCSKAMKSKQHSKSNTGVTPSLRYQQSLQKYQELPLNSKEVKKLIRKKQKTSERNILCSSWSKAVLPSLGNSQDVRRDKFFTYVERGSYHYVKGCLDAGMDLLLQNEYGQTGLFIPAWRGRHLSLVSLLLEYGCDPNVKANGGLTPLSVSKSNGRGQVVALLLAHGAIDDAALPGGSCSSVSELSDFPQADDYSVQVLIGLDVDHPGAGSYLLDGVLSDSQIDSLIDLWQRLPVEEPQKQKCVPCSDRSYFCDAEGWITRLLANALGRSRYWKDKQYSILPHMRFLCYSTPGAVLAPHVDLNRTHPFTAERSTHTFILYLTDCEQGGATTLLGGTSGYARNERLATVTPRRGHLLLFPHNCPHEGEEVMDVPKILIRGEVVLPT